MSFYSINTFLKFLSKKVQQACIYVYRWVKPNGQGRGCPGPYVAPPYWERLSPKNLPIQIGKG